MNRNSVGQLNLVPLHPVIINLVSIKVNRNCCPLGALLSLNSSDLANIPVKNIIFGTIDQLQDLVTNPENLTTKLYFLLSLGRR